MRGPLIKMWPKQRGMKNYRRPYFKGVSAFFKISAFGQDWGEGKDGAKSLLSSSLDMILMSNQHAARCQESIGPPLAVARIPHNQEAGRGLVGGVGS